MLKNQPQSTIPNHQEPITDTVFGNDLSHFDDNNLPFDATYPRNVIDPTSLRYNFRQYILSQVSAPIKELCNNYPDIVLFTELNTLFTECRTSKRYNTKNALQDDPLKSFQKAVSNANTLIHCFEICKELAPQLIEDDELLRKLNTFSKTFELLINKPQNFKTLFTSTTTINELHQFLMSWVPNSTPSVSVMSYNQWKSETGVPAETSRLKSAENPHCCYEYRQYLHTQLHDKLTIFIEKNPVAKHFLKYANKQLEFQFKRQYDSPKIIKKLLASNKEQQIIITLLKSLEKCALKLTKENNNTSIDKELRTYLNENVLKLKGKKCTFFQLITRQLKVVDNFYTLPLLSEIGNAQCTLSIDEDVLTFTQWKEKYANSSLIDSTGTNILDVSQEKGITTNSDTNINITPDSMLDGTSENFYLDSQTTMLFTSMPNIDAPFSDMMSDGVFQAEDDMFSPEKEALRESDDNQTPSAEQVLQDDQYAPSYLRHYFRLYIYKQIRNSIETLYTNYPEINFFKMLKATLAYKISKVKNPEHAESARANIEFNKMTLNANKLIHCLQMCEQLAPTLSEDSESLIRINKFSQNCTLINKRPIRFSKLLTSTEKIEKFHDFIKEIAPNCTPSNPVKSYSAWKLNTLAIETTSNLSKVEDETTLYSYNYRKFLYDKLHSELNKLIQHYPNAYNFLIKTQDKLHFEMHKLIDQTFNYRILISETQNSSISLLLLGLENCAKAFTTENRTNDLHEKFISMFDNLIFSNTGNKYSFSTFISNQLTKFGNFVIQSSSSTINNTTSVLATDEIHSFSKWKELIADNKSIENDSFRQSKSNVESSMTVTSNDNTNNNYSNISQDPLVTNSSEDLLTEVFDESVFDIDILHPEHNLLPNAALDETTADQEFVCKGNKPTFLRYEFYLYIYKEITTHITNLCTEYPNLEFFKNLKTALEYRIVKDRDPKKLKLSCLKNMVDNANLLINCIKTCKELARKHITDNEFVICTNEFSQECNLFIHKPQIFGTLLTSSEAIANLIEFLKPLSPNFDTSTSIDDFVKWKSKNITPADSTPDRFNYRSDLYIKLHNNLTTLIEKYAFAKKFLKQAQNTLTFKFVKQVKESTLPTRTYTSAIPKNTIILLLRFLEKCALSFTEIEQDNKSLRKKFHELIEKLITDSSTNKKYTFSSFIINRQQKLIDLNKHPIFSKIAYTDPVLMTNNIYTFKEWRIIRANEQADSEPSHQAPKSCNFDTSKTTTVTMTTTTNSNISPISSIPELEPEIAFSNTPQTSTDGLTKLGQVGDPPIYTPLRNTRSSTKLILKVRSNMNTDAINSDNVPNKKYGIELDKRIKLKLSQKRH